MLRKTFIVYVCIYYLVIHLYPIGYNWMINYALSGIIERSECSIPRFFATMYWKNQLDWWMTRAALHDSRVMHKIQYTMSAKHELCIGFYALQVMSAMQLESWIMSVGFFNILSQKSLEWHYDIMIGMNNNFWRFFNETCVKFSWNSIKLLALARKVMTSVPVKIILTP